jgi:hypothetical protein
VVGQRNRVVGGSAWGHGAPPRRSAACRPRTRRRAGCDLQGSEPNHRREDAESGSSSRPSAGFGRVRGRTRSRPLEGPRAGGEPFFAERLSHPSWPCTAARRTARSPRASAVSRLGTSARPLPVETPLTIDRHVQRSPFRRGSPAWSPLLATTSWRLRERPATAAPRSVLVVSHHLDGFLLQTSARVLHRAPDRRVRRVEPPCEGLPTATVHPSELPLRRQPPTVTAPLARVRSPIGPTFPAFPRLRAPPPAAVADDRPRRPRHVGSQGFAPPAGPLTTAAFPPRPSRCSLGLA